MLSEGKVSFCRYADDYRIYTNDLQTAYKAIGSLSEKLFRNQGLSLQKSKTRVMTSAEYISLLDPVDPPEGSAAKFLNLHIHFDPYSETPDQDYDDLRNQMEQFDILDLLRSELTKGRVHASLTRRLVKALKFMDFDTREQALLSLLDLANFDKLAPVLPHVLIAIRDCLDDMDDNFVDQIHETIRSRITEGNHLAQISLNLAYMIKILARRRTVPNEQLLIQLYNIPHGFAASPDPIIQRDIILILAKWGIRYWLSDQKNYVQNMHPWVKRAFLISSFVLNDEGKHWRQASKSGLSPFELVILKWADTKWKQPGWSLPV